MRESRGAVRHRLSQAQLAARQFGITEIYDSLDAICKSDLDAIAIITQPWLHAPQAIQVMQAGKHVYTAVPIIQPKSGSGDEILEWCDKLIDCCRRTGQHYMMGETTYFRPETVMLRKRAGEIGRFVYLESEYLHDTWLPSCNLIEVQMARTGMSEAAVIAAGGDVPFHYPTHSTSAPISITGAHCVEVSAFGYAHPDDELLSQRQRHRQCLQPRSRLVSHEQWRHCANYREPAQWPHRS